MTTVPVHANFRMGSRTWGRILPGLVLLFVSWANAADPAAITDEQRREIEQALPPKAQVQPAKPRRLLIFSRNVGYGGHRPSRVHAIEALTLMGKTTGAFETIVSEDPSVFERESLQQFDAVFLNNTIGNTFPDPRSRQNLLEFVTGGGGLMGVHGTSIAFMDWQWPPIEDWPEFGNMIGARGAYHQDDKEHVWVKIDEPDHPLNRAFGGQGFERRDEFFRFHAPYSRQLDRVLLSMDVAKTDLSGFKPEEHLLRQDNDYAVAWIRNYGRGRVFYCSLAHSDSVFRDPKMLQFYLDAAQFVLGDLPVPTTPSAKLSPAILAQEKLGWRLGIEAYTFHKFTFFETIEKTAELGLPYIGGLSFLQRVSEDIPKNFDQYLTDDELRHIRLKMDSGGVRLLTYYAQDIPADEAGCRKLFEFGRKMGFETFMCEPKLEQLDMLDKLANEYGINVAIHSHGQNITPLYWRPEYVLKACQGRSRRIGAAPDLGYWMRSGIDPIEGIRILKDRLLTLQMHDLHETGPNGHDVPWGTGVGKSAEVFRELHRLGIKPTMIGLEFSHNFTGSMPDVAKCIEFFNGTTLKLAAETPTPPIPATSIKGTVKNTSGACLAGARVKLESTGQSTTTDAKGHFSMVLAGLAPVTKTVTQEGYIDYHKDVVTITQEGYLDYQIHVPDQGAGEMAIEMIDCAGTVTDADGNVYQTVKIGDFVWTTTSLRTTKYNDGTPIPNVTDDKEWQGLSSPAWCYNENTPENGKNGLLYNWWAASHPKIAPKGWHVPSVEEQLAFRRYLVRNGYNCDGTKYPEWKGDNYQEKDKENKLGKSVAGRIGWQYRVVDKQGNVWEKELLISERPELNNKTGFNCLPNGARWNDGSFHNLTGSCYMWSSTEQASDRGWLSSVHNWSRYLGDSHHVKPTGFGIRLLKDKN